MRRHAGITAWILVIIGVTVGYFAIVDAASDKELPLPALNRRHPKLLQAERMNIGVRSVEEVPPLRMRFFNPVTGGELIGDIVWTVSTPITILIENACGGRECIGLHVCQIYYPPLGHGMRVEYDVYADPTAEGIVNLTQWERIHKSSSGSTLTPTMVQNPADFIASPFPGIGAVECWGFPFGSNVPVQIGYIQIEFLDIDPVVNGINNGLFTSRDISP